MLVHDYVKNMSCVSSNLLTLLSLMYLSAEKISFGLKNTTNAI